MEQKKSHEANKDCKPCINIIDGKLCDGKWFHYKAKQDKGYCKNCVKNEKLKT